MPIDYRRYPPNWGEYRIRILQRAGYKCERCGVENHAWIIRKGDEWRPFDDFYGSEDMSEWSKPIKVVLTIAHLDHDISHNEDSNLQALCQRCHLRHDAKQHSRTRRANRQKDQLKLLKD